MVMLASLASYLRLLVIIIMKYRKLRFEGGGGGRNGRIDFVIIGSIGKRQAVYLAGDTQSH